MERSLLIVKPNSYRFYREISRQIEDHGLKVEKIVVGTYPASVWGKHYIQHSRQPFFESLCREMADKGIALLLVSGKDAISQLRKLKESLEYELHASDSEASAEREIHLWFFNF